MKWVIKLLVSNNLIPSLWKYLHHCGQIHVHSRMSRKYSSLTANLFGKQKKNCSKRRFRETYLRNLGRKAISF